MKFKKIMIIIIILSILINISCIHATDNNTEILKDNNEYNIYVDINNGNDENSGDTWQTPVKNIQKAIDLTQTNVTSNIYLSNGTFKGDGNTHIKIENKNIVNIIGSNNTIIDGENLNQILTTSNTTQLTIKNIQFINAKANNIDYGLAITIKEDANVILENCQIKDNTKSSIYNEGTLTINNTLFNNNKDRVGDTINSVLGGAIRNIGNLIIDNSNFTENYAGSGGAIYNSGNLSISNSAFRYNKATSHGASLIDDTIKRRSDGGRGGDICNFGNAIITNTTFKNTEVIDLGYHGGSIYNNGSMLLKKVEISDINGAKVSDPIGRHSLGTAIANIGIITVEDSIIKNMITVHAYQGRIQGAVHNEGLFTAVRTVFENNHAESLVYNPIYYDIGTGNIYNTGEGFLNITSCVFLNNNTYAMATVVQDVMIRGGNIISLENNSWNGEDPLNNYHLYGTLNVTKYWKISLEPEYSILNIGEKTNISEVMTLINEKHGVDYSQLPDLYVTFDVNGKNITEKIIDGKATVEFNQSDVKGSYTVTANLGGNIQIADIDVGKELSAMNVQAEEIYYGDDATFYMTVTGNYTHQPTGKITVIIDGKKYNANINDTKAELKVSGLIPKTYDLIIKYEGDEDYCKSIFHKDYTVHKKPARINMTIDEINYGEQGIIKITTDPTKLSTQAYMYITDENNETVKKTVFVRNGTELKLKNYAAGEYNITIETWENQYYESANATAIFKVNKFKTNLTINATDINAGEDEILTITLTPKEVAGEATLIINNHTEIIYLKNGQNTVTINNVRGGTYTATVIFAGDKKYASSNATATFTAKKIQTKTAAKIENNTLYINIEPNATGTVLIYVNDDKYEMNLTDSKIELPINFKKAQNNIFIYYTGNEYYNYSTTNLTYEYEDLVNLTGYDETFYTTQNQSYYMTLTDEEGYGIPNKTITITINNETYQKITGEDGSIVLNLKLDAGTYTVTTQYKNKTTTNKIAIIEDAFITANDTHAYENIDFTFQATLKDHKGNPIQNAKITFTINKKTYTNTTNDKGIATLTLNLKEGNYIITSAYKTVLVKNNITTANILLNGEDLTFYNTENGTYTATLTDKDGNGAANQTITIKLNNKTYKLTTDNNGTVKQKISLNTGNYTITATYKKQRATNKITVLEDAFITANNTKAYENTDFPHIILLTDHNNKPLANREITFIFKNKEYTNTTNKNGIATLNLNLKEGNYTIKATYKNKTITNKLIIIDDSHLVGNDAKAYSGVNFTYRTKLTDHNNNPIKNAEITFNLNGKTYTNTTNSKGESTLTLNLETGNYTIKTTYKNITIENNLEIIEDYILKGNDIKTYSQSNFQYKVNLTDHNGKAIKNAEITFKIDGKTYTNTTNSKGISTINLKLGIGNHTIKATYKNTSTTNNLEMIEDYIISGNDIKAYADKDFQYKANLTDHNGKAIKNAEITFKIDGKTYTNKTDKNGMGIITLNLKEGNYTITVTYKNTSTTNNLTIIEDHMLTGQNIRAFENTDITYTATLTRTDNTPIIGETITFIINNRRYTATTDENGQATRTLNLPEGNYTITTIYKNTKITNNLTIIEEYNLTANNIKTYADKDFQFKVNLTDHSGKAIKNAEITFKINGKTYTNTTNNNGQAILNLNLPEGNYTITTTYKNIKLTNHLQTIETYQLTGSNVKSYENFDFEYIVTLKNHNNKTMQNQEITFNVNGKTYTNTTNNNGQAKITLNLKKGNYTITATYRNIFATNQLNIIEYDLEKIESQDLEMYYKDGSRFTIKLTENNTPLSNKTVKIIINGATYTRTTNNEGYAGIAVNLQSGTHNITTQYNNITKQNTITVKPTIKGNDTIKIYRNDTQYYAIFYNQKGETLKNTQIEFNINGVFYTRTTNTDGIAKLNINLNPGNYIITATNPETTEQHSNLITVISKIQENKDLTKYYRNNSQYTVKLIKPDGSIAGAGEKITFNINGVFYTRTTNESGIAKLNINLNPGDYIITAEYAGCKVSNNIKVLPTIIAHDLTKKYGVSNPFTATLLDGTGKPLANEKITFNINGVFYTRTTNTDGIAKLNINLQQGEYIITSQYKDATTSNTVKVTG